MICIAEGVVPPVPDRILVAETDFETRKQLHKRLLDVNLFSDCVDNGRAAMILLTEKKYAVVVLDLALGHAGKDQTGAERILEHIQALPLSDRPVVLVLADSGSARSLDVEVVQIVIRRPVNLVHVAELIQSCVKTASTHRQSGEPRSGHVVRETRH